ncbi:MAG: 30S ribosomal protein S13 [Patescibacteria group bacterium]
MRVAGKNIPENKRLEIALTYVFGIGKTTAQKILETNKLSFDKKVKDLSETEINNLRETIEKYKIEANLARELTSNIKRLKEIKTYRGSRHAKNLPVRGQNTKSNSRTNRAYRGRKTMTSGRRKSEKK